MKTKITLRTPIALTIVGLLGLTGIFYAANPSPFAFVNAPIGVAASRTDLIVTEYCGQNVDTIDCFGNVSLLATIPGVGDCKEKYVAIAPMQAVNAGFTQRDIFVTQGAEVWKISGSDPPTLFTTIPGCSSFSPDHTGITFDHVGTFGYNMIVTCQNGGYWRVDGTGTPTLIANNPNTHPEGPAVAPLSFGLLGGQIWVADEFSSAVHAISNTGTVTQGVVGWSAAESIMVIPSVPCTYCSAPNANAMFQAIGNFNAVYQYPPTDFTGLGGNLLVTSENGGGTAVITAAGGDYSTSFFDNIPGGIFEGGAVTDCDVPTPTPTPTATATFTPTATATFTPTATATATFTPTPTPTATATATATFTPTATATFTPTPTATPTATATATATATFTPTPTCGTSLGSHVFGQAVNNSSVPAPAMSVATGSSIYVAVSVGLSQTVTLVTDNAGNSYARATSAAVGSIDTEIWYTDNVAANANLIVTATFAGITNATIEAVEIQGAANPSLDTSGTNTGHSLIASASATSTFANDYALLSVVTPNNGNQSFTAVPPDSVIDAIPVPAPPGQSIAGADLGEQLGAIGFYTLSANITGHDAAPVDWAAAVVTIKSGNCSGSPTPTPTATFTPTSTPTATATATFTPTPTATATATPTPTPTPTPVCGTAATLIASGGATGGTTVTTTSFTLKANTTYLVFAYTKSATGDSATFSSTFSNSPTFNNIGAGSADYNNIDHEYGRWLDGGAGGGSGTITVTFVKNIQNQAWVHVVELCGNDTSAPIAQSAYATSPGTSNTRPYTADLSAAPLQSTNFDVYFLDSNENLTITTPVSSPAATNLRYDHAGGGSGATYFRDTPPSQSQQFCQGVCPGSNHHWGTIAVEIKRP